MKKMTHLQKEKKLGGEGGHDPGKEVLNPRASAWDKSGAKKGRKGKGFYAAATGG